MTTEHTPGPWLVDHAASWAVVTDHYFPHLVAITKYGADGTSAANARLIAAAPDLLEACKTFAEWLRREEAGGTNEPWSGKRDTPEGEAAWREWYHENIRLCDLAQTQALAALAKAGITDVTGFPHSGHLPPTSGQKPTVRG